MNGAILTIIIYIQDDSKVAQKFVFLCLALAVVALFFASGSSGNDVLSVVFRPIIYAVYAIAWLAECIGVIFVFGYLPHSWAYYDDFTRAGIEEGKNVTALLNSQHGASTAAFIDGTTQNRGHFLEAYRLGLIKVLVCYAVLTEGVDLPMTETVVLARPIARTNVGLYAQMVGRGLRLYPGKASCKVIDCVGVSNMPICTAATLIGKDVPAPKPEKEPTEKLPEEQDPIKVLEGNEIPDSWIKNQKEVNVMALGEGYTTHDVAWLDVKGGGRILPLPNVVYRISKPLPNGMVYLRKNKKCSRCAVPLQFVLDYVYQDLKQNHPQQQHIWDKKQRYKWDRQPITSEQISLIHKLAPDYKIDTKKMTRGDASRVIQLLAYAPKEQDAQEQAQEVQDDAT